MVKMIIVWALAALFTANSLSITIRSNYNAGTVLMWAVSLALIAYGIWHNAIDAFCQQGVGRVFKIVFLCGVGLFALLFVFVALSGFGTGAKGDEKAYIVLGAGVRGERVGDLLRRRLDATLDAWQENSAAFIVVTGGQGPQEDIPEALAMQRWLLERGVPAEKIILEDQSTSTEQNLTFAQNLLAGKGVSPNEPIAVVTSFFHCYRAGQYARKLGFPTVRTVPASISFTTFLPSTMREVLAVLYMWVFRRQLA